MTCFICLQLIKADDPFGNHIRIATDDQFRLWTIDRITFQFLILIRTRQRASQSAQIAPYEQFEGLQKSAGLPVRGAAQKTLQTNAKGIRRVEMCGFWSRGLLFKVKHLEHPGILPCVPRSVRDMLCATAADPHYLHSGRTHISSHLLAFLAGSPFDWISSEFLPAYPF